MSVTSKPRIKPDIRAITRLVPRDGNLVQGQSDLLIDPELAQAAARVIAENRNHYCPAEGVPELRKALAAFITGTNGVTVSAEATPLELLVTSGGTGALISIAHTYLRNHSVLLFEPYYPYHRRIAEELGGKAELLPLDGPELNLDVDRLRKTCRELKDRSQYPLKAVVVCSPGNPTGKVFTREELQAVADVCHEFDLLCISDEVYEGYVLEGREHISMAALPGMWERTITVNSFSKSWYVSGWRLGYVFGSGKLIAPINNANNVFYVNSATPLQHALAATIPNWPHRYQYLRELFTAKRNYMVNVLTELGFEIYDSGSSFYLWARIPKQYSDASELNTQLMKKASVAAVPASAFADSVTWDNYMRLCIAREDNILEAAVAKLRKGLE